MTRPMRERVEVAAAALAEHGLSAVDTAIILGTGLGPLAERTVNATTIPYDSIEGLPRATAPGHSGRMIFGDLFKHRCVLMQGRFHLYEGHSAADVAFPVYLLKALGAKRLIITNSAGALNDRYVPGDVMLIEDHLNFTGANPLTGPNENALGQRFPDMSRAYDLHLRDIARGAALQVGVPLREGIYAGIAGPSLETSAERRFLRSAGADAVGMSTVLEVIAAAHAGLPVLGLSAITNAATGGSDQKPDTIEEVLDNAATSGIGMAIILERFFAMLQAETGRRTR